MVSRYQVDAPTKNTKTLTAFFASSRGTATTIRALPDQSARERPAKRCSFLAVKVKYRSSFTLVRTAKPSFSQDVTIHRAQQFLLGCAGLQ